MRSRFILFLVCIGTGAVIGVLGKFATDNDWWYLAVPIAVAAGWWQVATPDRCVDRDRAPIRRDHFHKEEP